MKRYLLPSMLVAGAVVVWLLVRQTEKAKANKVDPLDEILGNNTGPVAVNLLQPVTHGGYDGSGINPNWRNV